MVGHLEGVGGRQRGPEPVSMSGAGFAPSHPDSR